MKSAALAPAWSKGSDIQARQCLDTDWFGVINTPACALLPLSTMVSVPPALTEISRTSAIRIKPGRIGRSAGPPLHPNKVANLADAGKAIRQGSRMGAQLGEHAELDE